VGTLSGGAHPGGLNGQDAYANQLVVVDEVEAGTERGRLRDMEAGGVCPTLNAFDNATESRATVLAVMGDHTHALTAEGHDASEDGTGRGTPIVAFSHTQGLDCQPSEANSPTLRTQGGGAAVSGPAAGGVRRLTPLECERLMGLPDDWTAGQADSNRYKQCGNAVVVPVAEWIGYLLEENA
jgi:DNA (cytosine-5)-methyltransferase 1